MRINRDLGWLAFLLLVACLPPRDSLAAPRYLVLNGQASADIVIADEPPRMVRLAAQELQSTIEKISGARLTITNAPTPTFPVHIYVGKSRYTAQHNVSGDDLKHGAYRIVSGADYLILIGHDSDFTPPEPFLRNHGDRFRAQDEWDKRTGETWGFPYSNLYKEYNRELGIWERDERGSFNAVCGFLRGLGVRWYLPDPLGEIVPRTETIELPVIDKTVQPDFILRYPYQYGRMFAHDSATRDEVLWQLRLGVNLATDVIGMWEASLSHGINPVHNRDEVKTAHPEYYAFFGGKRDTETFGEGRPCLSSQGLFEAHMRYVRALYDLFNAPMGSAMPQDGYASPCQCELCKDKGTPERGWLGQMSDYTWDYVNRAGSELYKTHPNRTLSCFAYGGYQLPPEKITRLSPNIVVGIAQARRNFYDPDKRKAMTELRSAWLAKMPEGRKRLVMWEYYLAARPSNSYEFMPVFFPHAIAEDLHSLKGISIGDFIEVYRNPKGIGALAATHLNLYVTSRFWWDADRDVDALLDEYYALFYGPVRNEMKTFIEYAEANWMDLRKDAAKISTVLNLFDKAWQKVDAESVYGKRLRLIGDYIAPLKDLGKQLARGRENVPEARVHIRPLSDANSIVLDGRLDEPAWEQLSVYGLGELQTGRTPLGTTSFRGFWCNDVLYLGIVCRDPDMESLKIGTTKRDDANLWNGDCVELLLETQTHSYYQLAFAPSGALVDMDRAEGFNTLWSSGADVAAHIGEGYWSLEIRLPLPGEQQEELDALNGVAGRKPTDTYPWSFNLCRQRLRETGDEFSAFSPTGEDNFHVLLKFAKMYTW